MKKICLVHLFFALFVFGESAIKYDETTGDVPDAYNSVEYNFPAGTTIDSAAVLTLAGGVFTGEISFSGTGHGGLIVISLTTAQRDALSPTDGTIIYNTTTTQLEAYENGGWGVVGSAAAGDAWGDAVDAIITPDADGTRDFGLTGTRFATGYFDGMDITGAIIVGGTVDGRDVATDGAKLDGIEALADVTDATNVTAAGALMDSEVSANLKTLALPASVTISAFGATIVDDATAADVRTTIGATNVTLAGSYDYATIAGQIITLGQVDLTTDVTGVLPMANIATGTPDGTKFVRDDGTLAVPAGSGGLGSNLSSTTDDFLSDNGTLRLGGTGGTNNEDLDFDFETTANTIALSSSTGATTVDFGSLVLSVPDLGTYIVDNTDATKKITFQASDITTGNTRTIIMADVDVDLGLLGEAAADSLLGRDSGSAGVAAAVTISSLAEELTPDAGSDYLVGFDGATNGLRAFAVENVGAAGGDSWGDVVDADIIPDSDGGRDIGSAAVAFGAGYFTGNVDTEAGLLADQQVSAGTYFAGAQIRLGDGVSEYSFGTDQHNYDKSDYFPQMFAATAAGLEVTGISTDSYEIFSITNTGTHTFTLMHEDGSSSTFNQFHLPHDADYALIPGETVLLQKLGTSDFIHVVGDRGIHTVGGNYDYLSAASGTITLSQVDLTTDVTGVLPAANFAASSDNLDDTDASIEWEDATDLDATGGVSANAIDTTALADMASYTMRMRNNASSGDPQDVKISALTEEAAPDGGDWLLAEEAGGGLRKIDIDNVAALNQQWQVSIPYRAMYNRNDAIEVPTSTALTSGEVFDAWGMKSSGTDGLIQSTFSPPDTRAYTSATVRIAWIADSGSSSGDVVAWECAIGAYQDGVAGAAYSDSATITDTTAGIGRSQIYYTSITVPIDFDSTVTSSFYSFRLHRDFNHADDNMTEDADVIHTSIILNYGQ